MVTVGTLGDSLLKRYVGTSLRNRAKAKYKDFDRVNFKNQKDYSRHTQTEMSDEQKVEKQLSKRK